MTINEKNVGFQYLTGSSNASYPAKKRSGNLHQNSFLTRITRFGLKYYTKNELSSDFKLKMI